MKVEFLSPDFGANISSHQQMVKQIPEVVFFTYSLEKEKKSKWKGEKKRNILTSNGNKEISFPGLMILYILYYCQTLGGCLQYLQLQQYSDIWWSPEKIFSPKNEVQNMNVNKYT